MRWPAIPESLVGTRGVSPLVVFLTPDPESTTILSEGTVDEESRSYFTVNAHRGLFNFNRLPFGMSSTLGIFQRVMNQILQ